MLKQGLELCIEFVCWNNDDATCSHVKEIEYRMQFKCIAVLDKVSVAM